MLCAAKSCQKLPSHIIRGSHSSWDLYAGVLTFRRAIGYAYHPCSAGAVPKSSLFMPVSIIPNAKDELPIDKSRLLNAISLNTIIVNIAVD